jgi:release factor glutamine methyltransferase
VSGQAASGTDAVRQGTDRLIAAGFPPDAARMEATVLARGCLGWTLTRWQLDQRAPLPAGALARYEAAIARRAASEPVAYILGEREFYGRPFVVTPAVLIPRPETELIVDEALAIIEGPNPQMADVGTGSGCLAVTLAGERVGASVLATDISAEALEVARRNATRHGVADRVTFEQRSLLAPEPDVFDVIVSNPPYVGMGDREALPPDVRLYEPHAALFAGDSGLDVIRELLPLAHTALKPRGWIVFEIGQGQSREVSALAAAAGLTVVRVRPDLAGIPRVVVARKPAASL